MHSGSNVMTVEELRDIRRNGIIVFLTGVSLIALSSLLGFQYGQVSEPDAIGMIVVCSFVTLASLTCIVPRFSMRVYGRLKKRQAIVYTLTGATILLGIFLLFLSFDFLLGMLLVSVLSLLSIGTVIIARTSNWFERNVMYSRVSPIEEGMSSSFVIVDSDSPMRIQLESDLPQPTHTLSDPEDEGEFEQKLISSKRIENGGIQFDNGLASTPA